MLKIAMCDDNEYFLDELERLIRELSHELSSVLPIEVERFSDGSDLIAKIRNGSRFDLILLDWDMPILNGEKTGQAIRLIDQDCLIMFVTSFPEFALRAIRLTTFRYIIKDNLQNDLPEALYAAYDRQLFRQKLLSVKTSNSCVVYLKIRDIIYVEHRANKNMVFTKQGLYNIPSRTFFKNIETTLLEYGFVKSYKGVMVNTIEIQELQRTDLLMSNGMKVPMSRNYHKDVMVALHHQMER